MIRPVTNASDGSAASVRGGLRQRLVQSAFDDSTRAFLSRRLRAIILLAGGLRPDAFHRATARSLLEMPVESRWTVQTCWQEQFRTLADRLGLARLTVRVMIDWRTRTPRHWPGDDPRIALSIERDPFDLRGTGGLLRDVVSPYEDDAYVLVADAGQLLFTPLWSVVSRLARMSGDVRMLARGDGSPGGLMLVRCGILRALPAMGFVDFKEQGLPRLARLHDVQVTRWRGRLPGDATTAPSLPLRHGGYLHALRCWAMSAGAVAADAVEPTPWQSAFAVVEPGATVASDALLHDTVVLAGGRVEAGAALVRCVIGPGGCVTAGRTLVGALIASPDRRHGGVRADKADTSMTEV